MHWTREIPPFISFPLYLVHSFAIIYLYCYSHNIVILCMYRSQIVLHKLQNFAPSMQGKITSRRQFFALDSRTTSVYILSSLSGFIYSQLYTCTVIHTHCYIVCIDRRLFYTNHKTLHLACRCATMLPGLRYKSQTRVRILELYS